VHVELNEQRLRLGRSPAPSGGDFVGVLAPGVLTWVTSLVSLPLTFWQWGVQMCTDPHFLVPRCYRPLWPVIHRPSISSAECRQCWTLHACTLISVVGLYTVNTNVCFIRFFDCINCVKMFGNGWATGLQKTKVLNFLKVLVYKDVQTKNYDPGRTSYIGLAYPTPFSLLHSYL